MERAEKEVKVSPAVKLWEWGEASRGGFIASVLLAAAFWPRPVWRAAWFPTSVLRG